MPTDATLDLYHPDTFDNGFPHEAFAEMRTNTPLFRHEHPVWPEGFWNATTYEDVRRVSHNSATFKNQPTPFLEAGDEGSDDSASGLLISLDAPDHTKMRKLINRGFTPRRVNDLTDKIVANVDRLIDSVANSTSCDLAADIAAELPLAVIADLVGVPEEDRHQIFEWTEQSFGFDPDLPVEARSAAILSMYTYADQLCDKRREEPADDLISVLLEADVDGSQLTQLQIDMFFLLLQNAGSETTRNLITTGTKVLLEHPAQLARLRAEPELMPTAIEELLRYTTPVMQFVRRAAVDTEVGGQKIAAGEPVVMWYSSANRDAAAFDRPDQLDLGRRPNDHVAFGAGGPHFCLGASLARLEAQIMFPALINRFVDLEIDGDPSTFGHLHSNLIDGYATMPIRWTEIRDA